MAESTFWSFVKYYFPPQIPFLLVWIIGIILSIYFWQQNQKKYTLTLIAFTLFLIKSIATFFITAFIYAQTTTNIEGVQLGIYSTTIKYISISIEIIAWVMVLITLLDRKANPTVLKN